MGGEEELEGGVSAARGAEVQRGQSRRRRRGRYKKGKGLELQFCSREDIADKHLLSTYHIHIKNSGGKKMNEKMNEKR